MGTLLVAAALNNDGIALGLNEFYMDACGEDKDKCGSELPTSIWEEKILANYCGGWQCRRSRGLNGCFETLEEENVLCRLAEGL